MWNGRLQVHGLVARLVAEAHMTAKLTDKILGSFTFKLAAGKDYDGRTKCNIYTHI